MNPDIDTLLARYYEGRTTIAEEQQLRQFFQQPTVPPYLQVHAAQFHYFSAARQPQPSARFHQQLAQRLKVHGPSRVVSLTTWAMRLAASVTLLLLGFISGLVYQQGRPNPAGAKMTVQDASPAQNMKKTLAFSQQPKTSASDRIRAVNQSHKLDQIDDAILQLLINTLNFDANVNVRLAAGQALIRFADEPRVREALIQSLSIQTDPNLQITLIDMLVSLQEKRAVGHMQQLVHSQQTIEAVRQRAQEGINRLALVATTNSPS